MTYSNLVISIPFTIISSIIIEKKKSSYKDSLKLKLKNIKIYNQNLEKQNLIPKEKTTKKEYTYKFKQSLQDNNKFQNNNQFKIKTKKYQK